MLKSLFIINRENMDKTIVALKQDFSKLRTGKVNTNIVDNIKIDYYGNLTPLNQVASVISLDATTISISPWEKHLLSLIEKTIQEENIGINPNNNGEIIKLIFPPMTTEKRKEIVKQSKIISENSKVSIRSIRKSTNDKIKKMEKDKDINQDEMKEALSRIQDDTDSFILKITDLSKNKELDIMSI